MEETIKIGLVNDQVLFRKGIKTILGSWNNLEVVFEAGEGFTVIESLKLAKQLPDVMLIDLSIPSNRANEYSSEQLTIDLCKHFPTIKIIILSFQQDKNYIAHLIKIGAYGYLEKDCDPMEVYNAIVTVHTNGSFINPMTLQTNQRNVGEKSMLKKPFSDITKREVEILQLTCQQYTADEIAEKLFISVKTVNGHRTNLRQKTGSRNVIGLVIYAIKHQIINLYPPDHVNLS